MLLEMGKMPDGADSSDPYQRHAELWRCFKEDKWSQWSIPEKITIMQQLMDFEFDVLGIPTIPVKSGMIVAFTLGVYDNESNEMWINIEHLANSSPEEVLQTVCHDVYNSNPCYLVNTLDRDNPALNSAYFKEQREWMNNQDDYKSAWSYGLDEYKNQPLEIDARAYTEVETVRINTFICEGS